MTEESPGAGEREAKERLERDTDGRSWLDRTVRQVCLGAAVVAGLSVLAILGLTGYGVFMRYVLGTPVTWIDELTGYLVVASVMFGAAEALRRGDHIKVDLLTLHLVGRGIAAIRILWMLLVVVFMAILLFSAWRAMRFSYDFGLYSDGHLEMPMWMPHSLLVVGAGLVLLAAFARIGRDLAAWPRAGGEER
ncbi:MAG: TRAP transporter small permease [Pseudomonadota bacterium]